MKLKECIDFEIKRAIISVPSETLLRPVYDLMKKENVHHIAVIDGDKFLGLVDYDGILNAVMLSPRNFEALKASDVMKDKLPLLEEEVTLENVVMAFKEAPTRALPFSYQGRVALITHSDFLAALGSILDGHQSKLESAEAKGELFMANPVVQRLMRILSDIGI